MKVKVDLDFLVNNQICLIIFVLHGKWRSIGGEGPGRVTRCAGMSSVCCSLIFDSWRFGHLGLRLIGFGIDRFHLTVGLVDFMTPLAVLSPSLLRCNPINSVWGEYV